MSRSPSMIQSVGLRLIAAFILIFVVFVTTAVFVGVAVLDQHAQMLALKERHFEQAMGAAELSREAEVMTSEVLERVLGLNRSQSMDDVEIYGLIQAYEGGLRELGKVGGGSDAFLEKNHVWQEDYVNGVQLLRDKVRTERILEQTAHDLYASLISVAHRVGTEIGDPAAQANAAEALFDAAMALSADGAGRLDKLRRDGRESLDRLFVRLEAVRATDAERHLASLVREVSEQAFDLYKPLSQSHRATLSAVRQTRILAQKITSGTHSYYLERRLSADRAIAAQEQRVLTTVVSVVVVLVLTSLLIGGLVLYINRRITRRLLMLCDVMRSHVEGHQRQIPVDGKDEIAEMARAFKVFVDARNKAESALMDARLEAERSRDLVAELAATDPLCGIPNRRTFDEHLDREWRRCRRSQSPLTLVMIDVDHFKLYNDTYGHTAGDDCLRKVAATLTASVERATDFPARYGGEEFVCILSETDHLGGQNFAEKLRSVVVSHQWPHETSLTEPFVTVSVGVASLIPTEDMQPTDLINWADRALYEAKSAGRNRIVVAKPPSNSVHG